MVGAWSKVAGAKRRFHLEPLFSLGGNSAGGDYVSV